MGLIDHLNQHHARARELFDALEDARGLSSIGEVFQQLGVLLVGHDSLERQLLYPGREVNSGVRASRGLVEHNVIGFCLYQADQAIRAKGSDELDFRCKCQVLRQMTEWHMDEEEKQLFPLFAATRDDSNESVEALFENLLTRDFEAVLRNNLQQVLSGIVRLDP